MGSTFHSAMVAYAEELGVIKPRRTRREIWAAIRDRTCDVIDQRKPYTGVRIAYYSTSHARLVLGIGFSKWNPEDAGVPGQDWNPQRGIAKARGRAIADLLDQLEAEEAQP